MKKIISILLLLLILTLSLVSCSSSEFGGNSSPGLNDGNAGDKGDAESDYTGSGSAGSTTPLENHKIIKTVNQTVQTDAYDSFMASLSAAITEAGGYTSSSNYRGDNYYNDSTLRYASITIRIPAENLDAFTESVDSIAIVTYFSESVSDVTLSYIDIESRIGVLEAEETALTSMLASATTVDQMLKIRESLLEVQSDLASLRSQKNSYDDRIAYSTVYLTVNEVRRAVAQNSNPTFFEEIGQNFSDNLYGIGQFFRSLGVWLIGDSLIIIIWAAVIVGLVFLYKFWRKKNPTKKLFGKNKNAKSEEKRAEEKEEKTEENK